MGVSVIQQVCIECLSSALKPRGGGEGHERWGPLDPGFISASSAAYSFVTLTVRYTSQSLGFLVYKLG